MHRKLFPKSKVVRRLPSIDKPDDSVQRPARSPVVSSPGLQRIRRYLTSDKMSMVASNQLNYLSPIKKPRGSSGKKKSGSNPSGSYWPTTTGEDEGTTETGTTSHGTEVNIADELELATEEPQVDVQVPDSVLLHKGNKLFWRINRTIDFRIYSSCGAIVIRSFDSGRDYVFEPIILSWDRVASQVRAAEASLSSYQHELSKHTDKQQGICTREEDDIIKQIKRKKAAEDRRRRHSMSEEDRVREQEQKELEQQVAHEKEVTAMRAKVVAFIIARLEANKAKDTGEITTCLMKRPSDASSPLEFEEGSVPVGVAHVGEDDTDWNKKECASAIRRKSIEVFSGLDETNQATRKADEKEKAIQSALDIVKMLSDRQRFNSLPGCQKKFQRVARKALFRGRLQKVQAQLAESEVYKRFVSVSAEPKDVGAV